MPPQERRPLSFLAAAGWTIGAVVALALGVQVTDSARPGARADIVSVTACYVLTYSLVIFAMLRAYERETPVRRVLAMRACSMPPTFFAIGAGAAMYPAFARVDDYMAHRFPTPSDEQELLERLMRTETVSSRIVLVVATMIVIPLCQEVFFGGVLYGGLRRGRVSSIAIGGTAVFFATSIGDARALPTLLPLALFLIWIRSRSGSLI